jgi:GTP pyrophosphokinase
MYEVKIGLYAGRETLYLPTGIFNSVELSTLDPVVVKSSACCRPTPFDKGVIGLLSERGLSLHRKDCRRLQMIKFQREDAVEVRWNLHQTRVDKLQKIVFLVVPRSKLFMLLSVAPEAIRIIDVVALNVATAAATAWEINFSVSDLYELKKVLKHFDRSGLAFEFSLEQ